MSKQSDMMRIDGNTVLCGVIGNPIAHSLSPAMHNAAYNALGMNWCYLPFLVDIRYLKDAVKNFQFLNITGINVTIPFKEAVLPHMDSLETGAETVGSVNTIEVVSGQLRGYNTDVVGFADTLAEYKGTIRRAALIGAGGAARAVLFALLYHIDVKHFTLFNRTADLEQARGLVSDFTALINEKGAQTEIVDTSSDRMGEILQGTELLVNCTPLGMAPLEDLCPVATPEWIQPGMIVYDLVYNPARTPLLAIAESRGATSRNGVDMLVGQGAAAFSIWTGREAPRDVMKQALLSALESQDR
ncbi:shikimate dehydrogenase [candidate division KSB1 bacterium]